MSAALELLDWRRRVADLYAAVRADPDPAHAHGGWRLTRDELFATHPQSPGPGPLNVAPYDERWRVEVALEPADEQELRVGTGTDGAVVFDRIGVLRTPWGGLDVWQLRQYAQGWWVPVKDSSPADVRRRPLPARHREGRRPRQSRRKLVVDLNFLYAPSCAHDTRWVCPLAPPGNVLDRPVEAGELTG